MRILVVADPQGELDPEWDTTLALARTAVDRGHEVLWCTGAEVALRSGDVVARTTRFGERHGPSRWQAVDAMDVVLLRTDPPVDGHYVETALLLDRVPARTLMVNSPVGVRVANEKLWALEHSDLCPETLVTASPELVHDFVDGRTCVVKPVDGHAGRGVLRLQKCDPNYASIIEQATDLGRRHVVVQPELDVDRVGNTRIFVHFGEPVAAVVRQPVGFGDFRIGRPERTAELTCRDREICDRLRPGLLRLGLVMVGLDVIDGLLVDVNVTSSGALHKSDRLLGTSLCLDLVRRIEHATRSSA